MYERTLEFETLKGEKVKETYRFHLNKAEVIKWLTTNGNYTLDELLMKLSKESDGREIMRIFDELLYMSYGELSLDGRRFMKDEETKKNFMESEAYSIIFTELVTDGKKAGDFISKVIPDDLSKEIGTILRDNPEGIPDELKDYLSEEIKSSIANRGGVPAA